jgi:hypothetical protein
MFDVERSVAGKWSKKEECWVEDGKIAVRWVDGQLLDGWMDKWMDGWMDGFGWVDGWMDGGLMGGRLDK